MPIAKTRRAKKEVRRVASHPHPPLPPQPHPRLPALIHALDGPLYRYACLLSHTKADSAAPARYLHDMLQLLLSADVYLDSSDLTDLRRTPTTHQTIPASAVSVVCGGACRGVWCVAERAVVCGVWRRVPWCVVRGGGCRGVWCVAERAVVCGAWRSVPWCVVRGGACRDCGVRLYRAAMRRLSVRIPRRWPCAVLFRDGVLQSETLVFIASPNALQSPWVLLELHFAFTHAIPVITLSNVGFSPSAALHFIERLEELLPLQNAGALEHVHSILDPQNVTIDELKQSIIEALSLVSLTEALRQDQQRCVGGGQRVDAEALTNALDDELVHSSHREHQHTSSIDTATPGSAPQSTASQERSQRWARSGSWRARQSSAEGRDDDAAKEADVHAATLRLAEAFRAARHVPFNAAASDAQILASLETLCNVMARETGRELVWTHSEEVKPTVVQSLNMLRDKLFHDWLAALREHDCRCSSVCGSLMRACQRPSTGREDRYRLFIAYDPGSEAGRGAARYLQLALQRELKGMVVEERGDEVEGKHMNDVRIAQTRTPRPCPHAAPHACLPAASRATCTSRPRGHGAASGTCACACVACMCCRI
jgi:hypothetical protein